MSNGNEGNEGNLGQIPSLLITLVEAWPDAATEEVTLRVAEAALKGCKIVGYVTLIGRAQ